MKLNNSGPAIFMYLVILVTAIASITCFVIHYSGIYVSNTVLWIGVVDFTIMYHLWVRIIMGNVTKLFTGRIKYTNFWFKERKFEKKLYKLLRVKAWKGKALTYNPEAFSLKSNSLKDIANNMSKAELDHWVNELISLSTIIFGFIWGHPWVFILSAIIAMIFDSQFIVIQRYNRPRVLKLIEREEGRSSKNIA